MSGGVPPSSRARGGPRFTPQQAAGIASAAIPYGGQAGNRRHMEQQKSRIVAALVRAGLSKGGAAAALDGAQARQASANRGGPMMFVQGHYLRDELRARGLVDDGQPAANPRRRSRVSGTAARVRQAADLYERFSGHDPGVTDRVQIEPIAPDAQLVAVLVGQLDGVLYTTVRDGKRERYIHEFAARDAPALAVSPDGRRIFILGGRYRFTERGIVDASDKST